MGFFTCFENVSALDYKDSIARLTIVDNTMVLNQFGFERKMNFWKDKTSRHLFLDTDDTTNTCVKWEIDWQNDSVFDLSTSFYFYNNMTFKRTSICNLR